MAKETFGNELDFGGRILLNGEVAEGSLPTQPRLEISPPKRFGLGALVIVTLHGAFLALPILLLVVAITLFKTGPVLSVALVLATMVATALILPIGLGNPYVTKLIHWAHPSAVNDPEIFIIQLTLSPRLRSGLRALIDDADDIGLLSFAHKELIFQGDSIRLTLPTRQLKAVRRQNVGLRGRFLYGSRIVVGVSGLAETQALEIAERSSWLLPGSRKASQRLYERLSREIALAQGP